MAGLGGEFGDLIMGNLADGCGPYIFALKQRGISMPFSFWVLELWVGAPVMLRSTRRGDQELGRSSVVTTSFARKITVSVFFFFFLFFLFFQKKKKPALEALGLQPHVRQGQLHPFVFFHKHEASCTVGKVRRQTEQLG